MNLRASPTKWTLVVDGQPSSNTVPMVRMGTWQCRNVFLTNVFKTNGTFLASGDTMTPSLLQPQSSLKHVILVGGSQTMVLKCLDSGLQDMATNGGSGHQSDVTIGVVDDQFHLPTFGVGQKGL
tara:strand:+ start:1658 stop:2029 length:372 start_codon:yes stop_codon:yes gene_type:complete